VTTLAGGLILLALAAAGALAGRVRQSPIPLAILLGLALRPWVAEEELVQFFGQLGLLLLLFFLGLEFSLPELLAAPGRTLRMGAWDAAINLPIGLVVGWAAGWSPWASLALGAAVYVTSSAIVARSVIDLRRTAHPETEVALRVLVFEDLAAALLLGVLATAGRGLLSGVTALAFLAVAVALGLRGRALHTRVLAVADDDLFVLTLVGLLLVLAWVAGAAGLSAAIGAFVAGLWVAETPVRGRARDLLGPFYGPFAAFFFFAFGTQVDPSAFARLWPLALLLVAAGAAGKLLAGWWIGRVEGLSRRARWALAFTLIPRGEFSVVIAAAVEPSLAPDLAPLTALVVLGLAVLGSAAIYAAPAWVRAVTGEGAPAEPGAIRAETAARGSRTPG
jgi:CPA2 family monovalent cation:H+ antiporter-2